MPHINLYRIEDDCIEPFHEELKAKWSKKRKINVLVDCDHSNYEFTYYSPDVAIPKPPKWSWIADAFDVTVDERLTLNKAIVTVKSPSDKLYVCSFGPAFYSLEPYIDTEFAFEFGRKLEYSKIKMIARANPESKRNKTIDNFRDTSNLIYGGGDSFKKISADVKLEKGFDLYKKNLEIGASINFSMPKGSLVNIANIIRHVEDCIINNEDKSHLPYFIQVKRKSELEELKEDFISHIGKDSFRLNIPEFDIFGTVEVFRRDSNKIFLKYKGKYLKEIDELSTESVKDFCSEYSIPFGAEILDIMVYIDRDGAYDNKFLIDYIEYIDNTRKCILYHGKWYKYNQDYIEYLNKEVAEIECVHLPEYRIDESILNLYKNDEGKPLYRELAFNTWMSDKNGAVLYDRKLEKVYDKYLLELGDILWKDTMIAVKINGNAPDLVYATDQSLQSIELIKEKVEGVKSIGLWFHLDRKTILPEVDGKPDLTQLNMLILHNHLVEWKQAVLLAQFKPIIYINYFNPKTKESC